MRDQDLRQDVVDELDFDPSINGAHIGVTVEKGVVTLSGHVGSFAEQTAAESAVRRVRGVRAVAEEIEVRLPHREKTADDEIATRALAALDWDAQVPRNAIMVRVQNGWVTLTGNVHWQYQRAATESALRKLSGVVGISNLIEVRPQVEPWEIKSKILKALKRNAGLEADSIRVTVTDDKVTLEGRVKAWHERAIAERAAWSAPGVKAVEDRLALG